MAYQWGIAFTHCCRHVVLLLIGISFVFDNRADQFVSGELHHHRRHDNSGNRANAVRQQKRQAETPVLGSMGVNLAGDKLISQSLDYQYYLSRGNPSLKQATAIPQYNCCQEQEG